MDSGSWTPSRARSMAACTSGSTLITASFSTVAMDQLLSDSFCREVEYCPEGDIGGHPRSPGTREWVALSAPRTDSLQLVNQPQTEVAALRCCVNRGRPFGDPNWVADTVKRLGLESTIRPRRRPKKQS